MFAGKLGFAVVLLTVCLSGQTSYAQSAPVPYWTSGWPGFGGDLNPGQSTDGRPLGLSQSSVGGLFSTRYNFSNGWFVGNERSGMGLTMNGLNQSSAFGSAYSEGVQFGYNFSNSPVTVYGGVNTW